MTDGCNIGDGAGKNAKFADLVNQCYLEIGTRGGLIGGSAESVEQHNNQETSRDRTLEADPKNTDNNHPEAPRVR